MNEGGVLRAFWHPVAYSTSVTDQPIAKRLLSEPIVLWRSKGQLSALHDLCVHRGTPLSLGWVTDEQLVCAYHGWHYGPDGACTRIPSLPCERGIPVKARVTAYQVKERYGLVWVCLGEPKTDIPEFPPEFDDLCHRQIDAFEGNFQANAARFIENMMDRSHFPWVHEGYLGDRSHPQIADVEIEPRDGGFRYLYRAERQTLYEVTLPFLICYRPQYGPDSWLTYVFIASPLNNREMVSFGWVFSNVQDGLGDAQIRDRTRAVYEQDRRVVEAQRPEELPLDLSEELHLRGPDAAAVEYRRRLRDLGVVWTH